jgi:outer membrane protein OmpA-like peptidoglycan-associated protein
MKWIICVTAVAAIAAGTSTRASSDEASTDDFAGLSRYERLTDASAAAGSDSASGATGSADTRVPVDEPVALPPVVVADHWVAYRSFWFDDGRADIRAIDERQVVDITAYLTQNPSVRFGIDNSVDPESANAGDRNLAKRRVAAVRDALIEAGTPAYRIEMGAFADPQHRRTRQVELFLIAAQ